MTDRPPSGGLARRATGIEAGLYLFLALLVTWPLASHLTTALPDGNGGPLFASWAMGWVMRQLTGLVTGNIAAGADLWSAPIFFPERSALALSEHFTGPSVQALPIWWATGNLILSYNIVLLLSFVLTALGVSLLVRDVTGSRVGGVIAGLVAAFNPYRTSHEASQVYTLSMQWVPFAMVGVVRYARAGSVRAGFESGPDDDHGMWPLVLVGLSVIALNLSSASLMLYAIPAIALVAIVAMIVHRRLADWRAWLGLAVAAICIALVTRPFVVPYQNVQQRDGLMGAWPPSLPSSPPAPAEALRGSPEYLTPAPQLPAIYAAVAGLDANAVLIELPFGDPWYELRYMFFATGHGRRLMNGHSGMVPPSHLARRRRLADPLAAPAAAHDALAGATHAVVHRGAWTDDTGARIEAWLESIGAVLVTEEHGAALLALESLRRDARLRDGRP